MKYDAFISYRRDNGFLMAQIIHDKLLEKGITAFLDLEELRSGKFDEKILTAIENSGSFILILPKNALNRCKNKWDWVRREILAAYKYGKRIIPVMYDGFKWPQQWHSDIPQEIRELEKMNGVSGSQEYLGAMIDKIISFMPEGIVQKSILQASQEGAALQRSTIAFFRSALERHPSGIDRIDMCFHAGAEWRQNADKVNVLSDCIRRKIKIRVLANTSDTLENITESMTQPLKKYLTYEECLSNWNELARAYPELVSIRVSRVPLLHRIYLIQGQDYGAINVKYYTYGNFIPDKDYRISFSREAPEYGLYQSEFDYLWEQAEQYSGDILDCLDGCKHQ